MDANEDNLFKAEGYALLGAAFEVHKHMGPGFLEEVYHEALQIELSARKLPFVSKPRLAVSYKGHPPKKSYEADLLVHSEIVLELKATRATATEHEAQLINELKATGLRVGYLINFGSFPKLQWHRRVISSNPNISVL